MIRINCDIGERDIDHPVDLELMEHIDIANIACGGHAGDDDTVRVFVGLARKKGVDISAHLSYPDKANFGRSSMKIPMNVLRASLDSQIAMLPDVSMVKFHGGLYNDSCHDPVLAESLADWLVRQKISVILAPGSSHMARAARKRGIRVLAEAFAERRYQYWPDENRLALMSRACDHASIHDPEEALIHSASMVCDGLVHAMVEQLEGNILWEKIPITCETLCVHSDSSISLTLAKRLFELNRNGWNRDV